MAFCDPVSVLGRMRHLLSYRSSAVSVLDLTNTALRSIIICKIFCYKSTFNYHYVRMGYLVFYFLITNAQFILNGVEICSCIYYMVFNVFLVFCYNRDYNGIGMTVHNGRLEIAFLYYH